MPFAPTSVPARARLQQFLEVVAFEGQFQREQLVKHHAHGPKICGLRVRTPCRCAQTPFFTLDGSFIRNSCGLQPHSDGLQLRAKASNLVAMGLTIQFEIKMKIEPTVLAVVQFSEDSVHSLDHQNQSRIANIGAQDAQVIHFGNTPTSDRIPASWKDRQLTCFFAVRNLSLICRLVHPVT